MFNYGINILTVLGLKRNANMSVRHTDLLDWDYFLGGVTNYDFPTPL